MSRIRTRLRKVRHVVCQGLAEVLHCAAISPTPLKRLQRKGRAYTLSSIFTPGSLSRKTHSVCWIALAIRMRAHHHGAVRGHEDWARRDETTVLSVASANEKSLASHFPCQSSFWKLRVRRNDCIGCDHPLPRGAAPCPMQNAGRPDLLRLSRFAFQQAKPRHLRASNIISACWKSCVI
jgi:hypothetical protein